MFPSLLSFVVWQPVVWQLNFHMDQNLYNVGEIFGSMPNSHRMLMTVLSSYRSHSWLKICKIASFNSASTFEDEILLDVDGWILSSSKFILLDWSCSGSYSLSLVKLGLQACSGITLLFRGNNPVPRKPACAVSTVVDSNQAGEKIVSSSSISLENNGFLPLKCFPSTFPHFILCWRVLFGTFHLRAISRIPPVPSRMSFIANLIFSSSHLFIFIHLLCLGVVLVDALLFVGLLSFLDKADRL